VVREGRGSVSLLQRALGIGYGRAARLIDYMAEDRIVGQYAGSQAREVLITPEKWAEMTGQEPEEVAPKKGRNKIVPVRDDDDEEPVAASAKGAAPKSKRMQPVFDDDDVDEQEEDEYDDDQQDEYEADEDEEEYDDEEGEAEDEELDEDHYAETA
jgi:S-DNA-T family DNA segregation ATPase FtsK/SpoIIIE